MVNQLAAFNSFANAPFSFNWHKVFGENLKLTFVIFVFCEMTVVLYVLYDLAKPRNFMPDKEYGVADWGVIEKINERFSAENEKENRVYSEKLRIVMNGDETRINNNVLVVGGSGVGKSVFLLTPNLYQANTESRFPGSFVITDPKGELLQKNGALLRQKGYKVKVINLVPGMMHESDKFNPFRYIRRTKWRDEASSIPGIS